MLKKYLILLIFFFICYNSYGQFNDDRLKSIKLERELNLHEITLGETLNIISQENSVTIIPSEEIKNTMLNLYFPKGEYLEDILNSFVKLYNLKIFKSGNIYVLTKRDENSDYIFFGKILSKGYDVGIEGVKVSLLNSFSQPTYSSYGGNFILTGIEPGVYIAKFEKDGYVTKGEVVNLSQKNSILNISLERDREIKNIKDTEEEDGFFSKIDTINGEEIVTQPFDLYNIGCNEIRDILKENYGSNLKVSVLNSSNSIVLSGREEVVKGAKVLIEELDRDREQIRVDAQILDVNDNLFETLGFNWIYNDSGKVQGEQGWNLSFLGNSAMNGLGNTYSSTINVVKQFNGGNDVLNLGINILESTQDLVISSRPSILVMDRKEGSFKVTEEVIVGEEREENDENGRVISTPIFREAGIILKVTPIIKKDGWIILKVVIEISNFKLKVGKDESQGSGTYNSEGGSKIGRSIETTIKIKDGETIFIGGLKRATVHNLDSKLPFFGTLPMINFFFRNQNISHEITDIYVKMRVNIVKDEKESFEREEIHKKAKDIIDRRIY